MARINLLPWRDELRLRRKKEFIALLLAGVVTTVVLMGAWHFLNIQIIDNQINRNQQLRNEIAVVNRKLKEIKNIDQTRQRLQARIDVIQRLQRSRPESVRLMDEMVAMMPEGVVLQSIAQAGNRVEIRGSAQSNARVSALMRNVEESDWITAPHLHVVENKQAAQQGMSSFGLAFNQQRPAKPASGGPQ